MTVPALAALAVVAAVYGATLYAESFIAGDGCCAATGLQPNPVQAERLLERADPKGLDAALQEQAARQVIAARPIDASGWLRLAYADALRNGRLTPQWRYALKTSYTMAAYAGRNAGWRAAFGLDHWYELDADSRARVIAELKALARDNTRRDAAKSLIGGVRNPVGRYQAHLQGMLPPPAAAPSR